MSKLNQLIQELCPDGVEYKSLGELGVFYGGLTGKSKEDFKDGNAKFITYKNVYSNPALKLDVDDSVKITENEKQHTLQYGDVIFTGSSETPDECGISSVITVKPKEKLYLNSFCFFFRFNNASIMLPDFAKHLFRSNDLRYQVGKTASGVTRYNVSKKLMGKVTIPVPPLEVQQEIVRILDSFSELTTELTTELTAELAARKQQYECYRDELLTFENDNIGFKKLGDLCSIATGKLNANAKVENGLYPFFTCDETPYTINDYAFNTTAIIISGNGSQVGHINFYSGKFNAYQRTYVLDNFRNINIRFLLYFLKARLKPHIEKNSKKGSVPYITLPMLYDFIIPIPSIEKQEKLVLILDKFDALCNNLSDGLPAEIEARQKQYEYYRDKLLNFKEKS